MGAQIVAPVVIEVDCGMEGGHGASHERVTDRNTHLRIVAVGLWRRDRRGDPWLYTRDTNLGTVTADGEVDRSAVELGQRLDRHRRQFRRSVKRLRMPTSAFGRRGTSDLTASPHSTFTPMARMSLPYLS